MLDHDHYVGPLGDLHALPGTPTNIATPTRIVGGEHQSLNGGYVHDIFGTRRSWAWTWPALTTRQATWVEALRGGRIRGPLHLLDPRRPNRLPEDVAAGGTITGSPVAFAAGGDTVTRWRPLDEIGALDHHTLPARRIVGGAVEWELLSTPTVERPAVLELAARRGDRRLTVPCLPDEPLQASVWVAGPPGALLTLHATNRTAGGHNLDTATGTPLELDPAGWGRALVDIDTGSAAGQRLRATVDLQGGPPGLVWATAWSLHRRDDPEDVPGLIDHCAPIDEWDDPTGGHRLGGGTAVVVPAPSTDPAYTRPGLHQAALVLTERRPA